MEPTLSGATREGSRSTDQTTPLKVTGSFVTQLEFPAEWEGETLRNEDVSDLCVIVLLFILQGLLNSLQCLALPVDGHPR